MFNPEHLVYELVYPIWLPRSGWWAGTWVRQSAAYVHLAVSQSGLQIQMVGGSPAAPMNRLWLPNHWRLPAPGQWLQSKIMQLWRRHARAVIIKAPDSVDQAPIVCI